MRRWLLRILAIAVLLLVVAYGAAGTVVYSRAMQVDPGCFDSPREHWAENLPDSFHTAGAYNIAAVDTAPYFMPDYDTVSFPSRDGAATIQAWFVPTEDESAPTVILVHGLHACRHSPTVLLPAGMLHQAGFQTLLIDLRNHGDSDRVTGRMSGGIHEYSDVLGAWDWLLQARGIDPAHIGLFGMSLGAATALVAGGEEPQVAAIWADSSYADTARAIDDELRRLSYPTLLGPAGILMGRLIDGVDITERTPMLSVPALANRAIFIAHSEADTRMPVAHARILAEALNEAGNPVLPWIVNDSSHAQALFDYTADYESHLISFFNDNLR